VRTFGPASTYASLAVLAAVGLILVACGPVDTYGYLHRGDEAYDTTCKPVAAGRVGTAVTVDTNLDYVRAAATIDGIPSTVALAVKYRLDRCGAEQSGWFLATSQSFSRAEIDALSAYVGSSPG
jgi:hypothetical protein